MGGEDGADAGVGAESGDAEVVVSVGIEAGYGELQGGGGGGSSGPRGVGRSFEFDAPVGFLVTWYPGEVSLIGEDAVDMGCGSCAEGLL